MKIVYVNDNDLAGSRFNGHDLQIMLNKRKDFKAKQIVVVKAGKNDNTIPMIRSQGGFFLRDKCIDFHKKISMQSVAYPFGEILAEMKEFKEADIVHYHLIFNYFMSLYSFKKLVKTKPAVWTLHDPWALTGHCVHPMDCQGWLSGCKKCPYLDRYSPLQEDNASSIWDIKKAIYKDLDIDIVVASSWMYDLVKKSPLTSHFKRVHLIPFGIDLDLFKRKENRESIREKIGIKKNNFVVMFRQDSQEWKGLFYLKEMLKEMKPSKSITLLTVGNTGLLREFNGKFQIIEYDWVNNNNLLVDLYSATDLFLMPSVAESFGLMAVEAMACSLPVIVFEGTALPKVTFASDCGIVLKSGDTKVFAKTVKRLIENPSECKQRGELGRKLAEQFYEKEKYHKQLIALYRNIYQRHNT